MKSVVIAILMCLGLVIYIQRETKRKAFAERLRSAHASESALAARIPEVPNVEFDSLEDAREAFKVALGEMREPGRPAHWEAGHDHTRCLWIQEHYESRQAIQAALEEMRSEG